MSEYESIGDKTDAYALRLLFSLCFVYLHNGSLELVNRIARIMLAKAAVGHLPVIQNWARFMLGVTHYQWNELEIAEEYFTELVSNRYTAHIASVREALNGLALIHLIEGEPVKVDQILDLLSQLELDLGGVEDDRTWSLPARLRLMQGDLDGAYRWADSYKRPVPDQALIWMEIPHLTQAHILLARNLPEDRLEAIQILEALFEIAERTYNTRYQIILLAELALALQADGKAIEAQVALQQAVDLARPGDFIRVFLDLGEPMRAMLTILAEQDHLSGTIRRILAAFAKEEARRGNEKAGTGTEGVSSFRQPVFIEPLTQRELEILSLMREPMSNKEIASRLNISPLTVKRHSINLYGKLGVNRRWDAVSKAISLGILSSR